jgi:regulator of replication initiation timing
MKTLNKVVYASKKKGQKVFDKMTKLSYEVGSSDAGPVDTMIRLAAAENQSNHLIEENDALRVANERLVKENEELRSRLRELKRESQCEDDDSDRSEGRVGQTSCVDDSLFRHIAVIGGYQIDSSPGHQSAWKPQSPTLNRKVLENYKKLQQGST